jgi:FkbM family methyltransferase
MIFKSYKIVAERSISNESRTLNLLMRENQHQRIDILKVDIEGHEYVVLSEYFYDKQVHRPCQIVVEVVNI